MYVFFLYCLTLKGEVWSSCTFEDKNENISSTGLVLPETVKNIAKRYNNKCIRWPHIIKKKYFHNVFLDFITKNPS